MILANTDRVAFITGQIASKEKCFRTLALYLKPKTTGEEMPGGKAAHKEQFCSLAEREIKTSLHLINSVLSLP